MNRDNKINFQKKENKKIVKNKKKHKILKLKC